MDRARHEAMLIEARGGWGSDKTYSWDPEKDRKSQSQESTIS